MTNFVDVVRNLLTEEFSEDGIVLLILGYATHISQTLSEMYELAKLHMTSRNYNQAIAGLSSYFVLLRSDMHSLREPAGDKHLYYLSICHYQERNKSESFETTYKSFASDYYEWMILHDSAVKDVPQRIPEYIRAVWKECYQKKRKCGKQLSSKLVDFFQLR